MDLNNIKIGLKIRTHEHLESTNGMMISSKHLDARRHGTTGEIVGWVPGHGGDVWWVRHDGSDVVAAYSFTEFEPET